MDKYIEFLSDPTNRILTAAEVYCLIRPEVKRHKKECEGLFIRDKSSQNIYKRDKHSQDIET